MAIIDDSIPTGPQYGTKYVLVGPDGTRVTFNDPSDEDNIGVLREVTGLDSPEVRESAEDLIQFDGGVHGAFFFGRRPITLSGILLNPESAEERNYRMTKLQQASRALRADAVLSWEVEGGDVVGGNWQQVSVRRQQPLRITGGWQKEFQLSLVAADPRIYSSVGFEATGPFTETHRPEEGGTRGEVYVTVPNNGNAPVWPTFLIRGYIRGVRITNLGREPRYPDILPVGTEQINMPDFVPHNPFRSRRAVTTIDTKNRTVVTTNPLGDAFGARYNEYRHVEFATTSWFDIEPGYSTVIHFATMDTSWGTWPPQFTVQWRNAWM